MPFKIGYREASEAERSALWEAIIASIAVTASISATMPDKGAWLSAALGTGIAAIKLFWPKIKKSKKLRRVDKQLRNKLIPSPMTEKYLSLTVDSIKEYLAEPKAQDKQLLRYYVENLDAEFANILYQKCYSAFEKQPHDEEKIEALMVLRKFCAEFTQILLDQEIVMQFTEPDQIILDMMNGLRSTSREVKEQKLVFSKIHHSLRGITDTLKELANPYTRCINRNELSTVPKSQMFSFRNPAIRFQGRKNELSILNEWLNQPGVSFWAITGHGGIGKSRLAFELDTSNRKKMKSVWLDDALLEKIVGFDDFSHPQKVLFICDYAAQYEEKLYNLIDKMSKHNANAKFLLLERSSMWYSSFLERYESISMLKYRDNPIDLNNSELDDKGESYNNIILDISREYYSSTPVSNNTQKKIIKKAKELSEKKDSVLCIILILLTDTVLRGESIKSISTEKLVEKYINRSRQHMSIQFAKERYGNIIDIGYRILAYATARDGVRWEEQHPAIQEDLQYILETCFSKHKKRINYFFGQISESETNGVVSPLKPDLIGEYLFLTEWVSLFDDSKDQWLSHLLVQEYGKEFLARCLTNWDNDKSNDICTELKAVAKQKKSVLIASCAEIFGKAFDKASTKIERDKYLKIMEEFSPDSMEFLTKYSAAQLNSINDKTGRRINSDPFLSGNFYSETKEDSQYDSATE